LYWKQFSVHECLTLLISQYQMRC